MLFLTPLKYKWDNIKSNMDKNKQKFLLYLIILPAFLIFFIFFLVPFISGVFISFTSWNGLGEIKFVGFKNFIEFFTEKNALLALVRTLWIAFIIVILQNIAALFFAVILEKKIKGRGLFKVIFFMPAILCSIVVGYMWSFIFDPANGVFNKLFTFFNLSELSKINVLGNPKLALYGIIFTLLWQYTGYAMVIYAAGLSNVPLELNEAGYIDGTNSWQNFRYITFPMIAPAVTINILLSAIGALKIFEHIFVMTGGGPGRSTESLTLLIYREGFGAFRLGFGTAAATILFIIVLIISLILLAFLRRREIY